MEIEYGIEVLDKNGSPLGTVDYVIRNSWTGEISKFVVYRELSEGDIAFTPDDVLDITDSSVKLDISSDELN